MRPRAAPGRCGPTSTRGVVPDALTTAKALGGGLPIGALVTGERLARRARSPATTARRSPAARSSRRRRTPRSTSSTTRRCTRASASSASGCATSSRSCRGVDGRPRARAHGRVRPRRPAARPTLVRRALLEQRLVLNATGPTTDPPAAAADRRARPSSTTPLERLGALADSESQVMTDATAHLRAHDPSARPGRRSAVRARAIASYEANPDEVNRVLLLYSGGLDTSVMLKWIQDEYEAEVVTLTVNLGQPGEDYEVVEGKAKQARRGRDLRRRRARGVRHRLRRPRDQGQRDLRPRLSAVHRAGRPLIAKLAVENARQTGCDTIAHGCTGKGNDQVRIEATVATLAPELKVIAPVRGWQMGRDEEIAYAREHGIPVKGGDRGGAVLDRRQPLGPLLGGEVDRGPLACARGRRVPARDPARGRAGRAGDRRGRVRARRPGRAERRAAWRSSTCSSARPRSACATASASSTTSRTASSA